MVSLAGQAESHANTALDNSNLLTAQRNFVSILNPSQITIPWGLPTSAQVWGWLRAETQNVASEAGAFRESVDADVILLVVERMSGGTCGISGIFGQFDTPMSIYDSSNSEEWAFAVLALDGKNEAGEWDTDSCLASWSTVSPHELGHLLFAEHEPFDDPAGNPTDTNGDLNLPTKNNHPRVTASSTTIMGSGGLKDANDNPLPRLLHFSGTIVGHQKRNVKNLVKQKSWAVVSAYRPIPAPANPLGYSETVACATQFLVSWEAGIGGGPATSFDVEVQLTTGEWLPYFLGIARCLTWGFNNTDFRVKAIGPGGESGWTYFSTSCSGGGGPPL